MASHTEQQRIESITRKAKESDELVDFWWLKAGIIFINAETTIIVLSLGEVTPYEGQQWECGKAPADIETEDGC